MQSRTTDRWRAAVHTIADAWRNWRERRRDIVEFEQADVTEMSEVAQDLGMSAVELRALVARGRNSAKLLEGRLQALGLESTRVDPAVMRDLQRCCSQCHNKALCIHELEDKPKGASWPSYCPNNHTIRALEAVRSNHREAGEGHQGLLGGMASRGANGDHLSNVVEKDKADSKATLEAEARLRKAKSQFYSLE